MPTINEDKCAGASICQFFVVCIISDTTIKNSVEIKYTLMKKLRVKDFDYFLNKLDTMMMIVRFTPLGTILCKHRNVMTMDCNFKFMQMFTLHSSTHHQLHATIKFHLLIYDANLAAIFISEIKYKQWLATIYIIFNSNLLVVLLSNT